MNDSNWKSIGKAVWFIIPLLAFLIMGFLLGAYWQGKSMETALANDNISICKDSKGKLWIKEDTSGYSASNYTYALNFTNYSQS